MSTMPNLYEPESEFLKAIIADEVPLSGSTFAEENLARLVWLTRDADRSNRDWATMLLAQQDADSPDVRQALLDAAGDEDRDVRAEAVLGLARRSRDLALPHVLRELSGERATSAVFEAAGLVAHRSLVEPLRSFTTGQANDPGIDEVIRQSLRACKNGKPVEQWPAIA